MRWLMIFTFTLSQLSWAETVVYRAPGASRVEYLAKLRLRPEAVDPIIAHKTASPSTLAADQLLEQFAEAQKQFLSGKQAKSFFAQVMAQLSQQDWQKSQREIFHYGALRMAQLSNDAKERDEWLLTALQVEKDIRMDADLFPPPLMARYRTLKATAPRVDLSENLDGFSEFLINGVSCTRKDCAPTYIGGKPARVTALSDQWVTQSQILTIGPDVKLQFQKNAWVNADCTLPASRANAEAFCTTTTSASQTADVAAINLQPTVNPLTPPTQVELMAKTEIPKSKSHWAKNKWLWIGLGAVAAAVAISAQQNPRDSKKEPTITYN